MDHYLQQFGHAPRAYTGSEEVSSQSRSVIKDRHESEDRYSGKGT
jgi:hypothetical protein